MRKRRLPQPVPQPAASPSGATLTEVLMAILIMGIGIVAIATFFPSSVLRSINATKLTNATLLRYNAEAAIDTDPDRLVHDPDRDGNFVEHTSRNYIVDPLGWALISQSNGLATANVLGTLPRFNAFNQRGVAANTALVNSARAMVTLPDSWPEQFSAPVSGFTTTTATLTDIAASDLAQVDLGGASRVVLIDANNKQSHVRTIASFTSTTVNWTGALPTGFAPAEARIETRATNFTWLLTVRNNATAADVTANPDVRNANVDVVVFFRRQFNADNERVFKIQPAGGSKEYQIPLTSGGSRPFLKKGGFVLDVNNTRWYRIAKIENENSLNPKITLDVSLINPASFQEGIFMPGVVDVYPLGTKNIKTN